MGRPSKYKPLFEALKMFFVAQYSNLNWKVDSDTKPMIIREMMTHVLEKMGAVMSDGEIDSFIKWAYRQFESITSNDIAMQDEPLYEKYRKALVAFDKEDTSLVDELIPDIEIPAEFRPKSSPKVIEPIVVEAPEPAPVPLPPTPPPVQQTDAPPAPGPKRRRVVSSSSDDESAAPAVVKRHADLVTHDDDDDAYYPPPKTSSSSSSSAVATSVTTLVPETPKVAFLYERDPIYANLANRSSGPPVAPTTPEPEQEPLSNAPREAVITYLRQQTQKYRKEVYDVRHQVHMLTRDLTEANAKCQRSEADRLKTLKEYQTVLANQKKFYDEVAASKPEAMQTELVSLKERNKELMGRLELTSADFEKMRIERDRAVQQAQSFQRLWENVSREAATSRASNDKVAREVASVSQQLSAVQATVQAAHDKRVDVTNYYNNVKTWITNQRSLLGQSATVAKVNEGLRATIRASLVENLQRPDTPASRENYKLQAAALSRFALIDETAKQNALFDMVRWIGNKEFPFNYDIIYLLFDKMRFDAVCPDHVSAASDVLAWLVVFVDATLKQISNLAFTQ